MARRGHRHVARALRAGGPEVSEVGLEELPPSGTDEAGVRVEAVGLNHAETLIRRPPSTLFRIVFRYQRQRMHCAGPGEFSALISEGLTLAIKRREIISDIVGRFALNQVLDACRKLECNSPGKVLVLPGLSSAGGVPPREDAAPANRC